MKWFTRCRQFDPKDSVRAQMDRAVKWKVAGDEQCRFVYRPGMETADGRQRLVNPRLAWSGRKQVS